MRTCRLCAEPYHLATLAQYKTEWSGVCIDCFERETGRKPSRLTLDLDIQERLNPQDAKPQS